MPRRGNRITLARRLYQDATGYAIVVKGKEYRFPKSTPLARLRDHQRRLEREAKKRHSTGRGSLVADITRYLALITLAGPKTIKAQLMAWDALYPGIARHALTAEHVLLARKGWLEAGDSPKTINHRVHRLRRLYRVLDGADAWTPCDGISDLAVQRTPIERTDAALVNDVLARLAASERSGRLPDAKHRARLMVIAVHGKRPSEVMRAKPDDVNRKLRVWIPRDGKGGYTPGLYLNAEMLAAWDLFFEADAWGPFNVSKWIDVLKHHGWPVKAHPTKRRADGTPFLYAHPRPYNLRHTTAIMLSELGHDLGDISPMLGHKQIETTRRHYLPVLGSRMQRLSESLEGRFGWARGTKRGTRKVKPVKSTR